MSQKSNCMSGLQATGLGLYPARWLPPRYLCQPLNRAGLEAEKLTVLALERIFYSPME